MHQRFKPKSMYFKTLLFLGIYLGSVAIGLAQQINVQVVITPPYSNKLEDYINKGNNVLITVTNTSQISQQIKLIPALSGNNGVMAAIREDYLPSSPVVMAAGETRTFSYNQLRVFNSNLQRTDIMLQGIGYGVLESSGTLPEGTYNLCVKAIRYGGTEVLSGSSGGCGVFLISAYDPPVLLNPQQNAEIKMPQPQLLNFQWTPSGISGKTRYNIKIADITALNVFNPNDAFNNPSFSPYFEQTNIMTSAFAYDMSKPKLFKNRKYAVQIIAYDPDGKMSYKNNGKSEAHQFTVTDLGIVLNPDKDTDKGKVNDFVVGTKLRDKDPGSGGESNPPTDPNDSPDCMSAGACQISEPDCGGGSSPNIGAMVNVGKFKMKVTQIQGGNGSGEIEIPYLQTKVEVSFQNLTVNAKGEMCGASLVWVKAASQDLIPEQMIKQIQGAYSDQGINWQNINQHIQQNNKKVSLFTIGQIPKTLPFVLDLGPGELIILGMVFTPTAAYANIAFSAPVPVGTSNQHFSMGMKGICIRPNGFGISEADARLTLSSQLSIPVGQQLQFVLEGGANGSYVKFDCKGVTEIKLKGGVEMERSLVLPVDNTMNIVPAPAKFRVNFDGIAASMQDWMVDATASHPAMTTAESNGFKIGFEKLIIDFSKTKNPQGTDFPDNHPMHNSPVKSSWTGVILSNPVVSFPDYLKKSDNKSIKVNVSSIVLDGEGLWTKLAVENVIDKLDDGSFGGWGFAIYQFNLDIRKSELKGGGMAGAVNIPITEVGVGFDATYQAGTQNSDMEIKFGVNLQDQLDIDMIFAKASLHQGSELKVVIEGGKAKPNAILHGSLTIGWNKDSQKKPADDENNDVAGFELPSLNFQGFSIFNDEANLPNLSLQSMQMANINALGKLSGFPIKLSGNPGFQNDGKGQIGFHLGLEFTLSKDNPNGMKGSTDFTIFAKYDQKKRRFSYDRTQLKCIAIENLDIAVASISGELCIYKDDPEFGNGFSGRLDADISAINVGVKVALGVGNVDNFDYFYFEGLVKLPGIPISQTMSLYGFGGGFHYNMSRAALEPLTEDQYPANNPVPDKPGPGYSPGGLKYTPSKGVGGFNATVVFGLSGGVQAAAAFNGDLTFWMQMSDSDGIEAMGFEGGGYLVQPLSDREGPVVAGTFEIILNFKQKTLDLNAELTMKLGEILDGKGTLVMHASQNEWFIHLGKWDVNADPNNYAPWQDEERVKITGDLGVYKINYNLYFMMGSTVPGLPPLPGLILTNLNMQDGSIFQDPRTAFPVYNQNNPGFAFGGGFHANVDIDVMIFYAKIGFFAGFDVEFAKKNKGKCENLGINGWRAAGQAYAYLDLEAGLKLDIWVYKGEFKLVDINVAALLYAEFPNPNYVYANVKLSAEVLNGLIKVNKQVKFEIGQKANCGQSANAFAGLPIIEQILPDGSAEAEVYDDIRVAFNFPKGTFKVFNEEFPDEPARYYYYKIVKTELKKGNSVIPLAKDPVYTKDGYGAKFPTLNNAFFPEKSELTFSITVKGYEALKGGDKLVGDEPPYVVIFDTKNLPDIVPAAQMRRANPTNRQRYYLQGDNYHGFLETFKDFSYLLKKETIGDPKVFDQSKTEFVAQFIEMGTGKIREVPLTAGGNKLNFPVPDELKLKNIYQLKLLARLHPKVKAIDKNASGKMDLAINDSGTGTKETEIVKGAYKVSRFLMPSVPDKTVEHVMASWYFQTSMYKTLQQKLTDYKTVGTGSEIKIASSPLIPKVEKKGNDHVLNTGVNNDGITIKNYLLPAVFLTGKEGFDRYDLYGYTTGADNAEVFPLVRFMKGYSAEAYHNTFYATIKDKMTYNNNYEYNALTMSARRDYGSSLLRDFPVSTEIVESWPNNKMTGAQGDVLWSYYSKHSGLSGLKLPKGTSEWKPEGPLTKKEIDDAVAATNFGQQGNQGVFQIIIKGNQPPGQGMGQGGLNIKSNVTPVYVMVNTADFLALKDYHHVITTKWKYAAPAYRAAIKVLQDAILPLLIRDIGDYSFNFGNVNSVKQFNYKWYKKVY